MVNQVCIPAGLTPTRTSSSSSGNVVYVSSGLTPKNQNLVPIISAPLTGAISVSQPITFSWSSVPDAIGYQLQVADTEAKLDINPVIDTTTTAPTTTEEVSGLDPSTTYYARVRAQFT